MVHLQSGFRGANIIREEELWNSKMSSVKQAVEWIFGDIVNFFKFLDLEIGLSPIGKMYIVSALLHNSRSCFYGTITLKYFDVNHPLLTIFYTLIGFYYSVIPPLFRIQVAAHKHLVLKIPCQSYRID